MYREDKIRDVTYKYNEKTGEILYTSTKRRYLEKVRAVSIRSSLPNIEYELEGIEAPNSKGVVLKEGELYKLRMSGSDLIFRLIKHFPDKSIVVMQVLSDEPSKFRLMNKEQCEELGIAYQNFLAVFSAGLGWISTSLECDDFDPFNLSTYDKSIVPGKTGSIRYMIVELPGFRYVDSDTVCLDWTGRPVLYLDLELLLTQLEVSLKKDIISTDLDKYNELSRGTYLSWSVVRESFPGSIKRNDVELLDQNGSIYLILDFTWKGLGICPLALDGIKLEDLISVSINTSFNIKPGEKPNYLKASSTGFVTVPPEIFEKRKGRYWKKGITGQGRFLISDK